MDIRREQFGSNVFKVLQDVAQSHFIAFDLEFSGIPIRSRDRLTKPSLQENYLELRKAVHQYQILQMGLTLIKFDQSKGRYIAQPYNFNISPLPELRERQFRRTWSMNSGAISFLQRHGFDFGTWITHGIPYLSRQEETEARENMEAESVRQDMVWKQEDEALVAHIRSAIAKWQAQPKEQQEESLNIPDGHPEDVPPEFNRYQLRLTHQIVQNEYPGLVTRGMGHFVQVTNPNSEQQASQKRVEGEQRKRDLAKAVGFRWILEGIAGSDISQFPDEFVIPALPETVQAKDGDVPFKAMIKDLGEKLHQRRKILIGHNCLTDLMYIYKTIIGDLPDNIGDFSDKLHDLFPAIVDTKFLASCFSEKYGRQTLGDVEFDLRSESIPRISSPPEFDRYIDSAYYHEAGFDSYITAIVAIKLSAKLHRDGSARRNDRERQEEQVAEIAAAAPPEFGVEEGYVTAAESLSSSPVKESPALLTTNLRVSNELPSNPLDLEKETLHTTPAPTSVIAVKESVPKPSSTKSKSSGWSDKSAVDNLRSAFASTSIWDKLGSSNDSKMPGEDEEQDSPRKTKKSTAIDIDKMVKKGELMPRWHEEAAFWEFYGNKLQVNGTKEGVLKLTR